MAEKEPPHVLVDGGAPNDRRECEPTIYVVIPVHNRWHFTHACLRSFEAQTYSNLILVVVDDGSTDGTHQALSREFPNVVVLNGDGGLWWSGSVNLGIQWVLKVARENDLVLTANNDMTVNPDYVSVLVAATAESDDVLVGSVAVDMKDRDTIFDGGPSIDWFTGKTELMNRGRSLSECIANGVRRVHPGLLSGRGTLIPTRCLRECGLFDAERLPQYAADYEFSARVFKAGYTLMIDYEAPVFSAVEATGVSTRRGRIPWRAFFTMFVSRRSPSCLLYRWRFARLAAPRRLWPVFLVVDTARVVLGALRDQLMPEASTDV